MPMLPGDPSVPEEAVQSLNLNGTSNGRVLVPTLESALGSGGKKSKKSKSTEARGPTALPKSRGTGLEEYYADPPITPQEFSDEKEIYDPNRPFHERIEECIQRFRARRRLDSLRTDFFNRYLYLGGIDTTTRMFTGTTGMDKAEIAITTRGEMRSLAADDVVQRWSTSSRFYSPNNAEHWDVDFEGVAAGFLSHHLPSVAGGNMAITTIGIDIVDNFLRYVVRHDACPEYKVNIDRARAICARAAAELPVSYATIAKLPGDFNKACCKLFCKSSGGDDAEPALTFGEVDEEFDPARVFRATVALQPGLVGEATSRMARDLGSIHVVSTAVLTLEVIDICKPSDRLVDQYAGIKSRGQVGKIQPVGKLLLKHCIIQDGWERSRPTDPGAASTETLLVEKSILDTMDVKDALKASLAKKGHVLDNVDLDTGFKIYTQVCELNCGLKFIKEVLDFYPPFYTFLPQELMFHYKEPVPNERPAPSVDNPTIEEDIEARAMENEMRAAEKDAEKAEKESVEEMDTFV